MPWKIKEKSAYRSLEYYHFYIRTLSKLKLCFFDKRIFGGSRHEFAPLGTNMSREWESLPLTKPFVLIKQKGIIYKPLYCNVTKIDSKERSPICADDPL